MSKTGDDPSRRLHEPGSVLEHCGECGRETPHAVSIEILEEGSGGEKVAYSREPYRVSVCERCGSTEQLRMNDQ
jgi:hypothetical protein